LATSRCTAGSLLSAYVVGVVIVIVNAQRNRARHGIFALIKLQLGYMQDSKYTAERICGENTGASRKNILPGIYNT
jgi:hypothetical protein